MSDDNDFANRVDRYRNLFHLWYNHMSLDPRLQPRFDSSDIVQVTVTRAHIARDTFAGTTEAQLVSWLQQILRNVVIDEIRRHTGKKNDVAREKVIQDAMGASTDRLDRFGPDPGPSPEAEAQRNELMVRLADAVEQLLPDQREVFLRRDLNDEPIPRIAVEMQRTERAVAGLLQRARKRLRELLGDNF